MIKKKGVNFLRDTVYLFFQLTHTPTIYLVTYPNKELSTASRGMTEHEKIHILYENNKSWNWDRIQASVVSYIPFLISFVCNKRKGYRTYWIYYYNPNTTSVNITFLVE